MATDFTPFTPDNLMCEFCSISCNKISDWKRHIQTKKHISNKNGGNGNILATPLAPLACECGKTYTDRTGLWRHKKKCSGKQTDDNNEQNLIVQLIKQNQDFKDLIVDQNKTIIEAIKHNTITNNNSINNVNSNNKTFNLQVFLNEDCKDAMNVSDFMNSLNLQVSDLECVGQLGFVEGISNIIIKRLNAMDITKRPVHCTDSKRETIYIKEDGVWTKDDDDNMKIRKLVRGVSSRNCKNATAYKAMYPEWKDPESKHSYIYDKIVLEAFGGTNNGKDEENENKIIRKILKHLTIDKSAFIQ